MSVLVLRNIYIYTRGLLAAPQLCSLPAADYECYDIFNNMLRIVPDLFAAAPLMQVSRSICGVRVCVEC